MSTETEFVPFYRQYENLVRSRIRRRLRNDEDVDVATNEVMLRAWRTGTDGLEAAHAKARLMRIINSVVVDMWRGRKRKEVPVFSDLDIQPDVVDRDNGKVMHWLTAYLDQLPPGQVGEVIQCGWEVSPDCDGYDYQEMGKRLGRSPNGVRSAVWKIKSKLLDEFGLGSFHQTLKECDVPSQLVDSIARIAVEKVCLASESPCQWPYGDCVWQDVGALFDSVDLAMELVNRCGDIMALWELTHLYRVQICLCSGLLDSLEDWALPGLRRIIESGGGEETTPLAIRQQNIARVQTRIDELTDLLSRCNRKKAPSRKE
ncbi:MAG: sigma-70 family RNA polymerase sigma factor [Gemmataceae bacterium]|nr:sigma-70 family RNA polymerase sigma factor [Gemmataceae bacterium]